MGSGPLLYNQFADWWHLLSRPEDYKEEAALIFNLFRDRCSPFEKLLELGSGGGNTASHLKQSVAMTLVDSSPEMITISRRVNPELEHIVGDMRTVRLDQYFDGVFIHDAIMYMTSEGDLRRTIVTAAEHCRKDGLVVILPDCVSETFMPGTKHGGHDGKRRGMRYVEWTYDPNPNDSTYICDFAYLMKDADGSMSVAHDRHIMGLFAREIWLKCFERAGLDPEIVPLDHSELTPGSWAAFCGRKK